MATKSKRRVGIETGKGICPWCKKWVLRGGKELPMSGWWHKGCLRKYKDASKATRLRRVH